MAGQIAQGGSPKNVTATAVIFTTPGTLIGFYVNSTSSGTLVLRDGGASGTALSGTITPAIGFHCFPAGFNTNLHATIASTLDVTFFYQP